MTFDDGPNSHAGVSERLLDVLAAHDVKATFCHVGRNVERSPTIVARAYRAGHEIALHSHTHAISALLSRSRLREEVELATQAIRSATGDPGYAPRLIRPPIGVMTPGVHDVVAANRLQVAHLTFFVNESSTEGEAWRDKLDQIKRRLIRYEGGAIVLHEMRYVARGRRLDKSWLPRALDELIRWARAEGLTFAAYRGSESTQATPAARQCAAPSASVP